MSTILENQNLKEHIVRLEKENAMLKKNCENMELNPLHFKGPSITMSTAASDKSEKHTLVRENEIMVGRINALEAENAKLKDIAKEAEDSRMLGKKRLFPPTVKTMTSGKFTFSAKRGKAKKFTLKQIEENQFFKPAKPVEVKLNENLPSEKKEKFKAIMEKMKKPKAKEETIVNHPEFINKDASDQVEPSYAWWKELDFKEKDRVVKRRIIKEELEAVENKRPKKNPHLNEDGETTKRKYCEFGCKSKTATNHSCGWKKYFYPSKYTTCRCDFHFNSRIAKKKHDIICPSNVEYLHYPSKSGEKAWQCRECDRYVLLDPKTEKVLKHPCKRSAAPSYFKQTVIEERIIRKAKRIKSRKNKAAYINRKIVEKMNDKETCTICEKTFTKGYIAKHKLKCEMRTVDGLKNLEYEDFDAMGLKLSVSDFEKGFVLKERIMDTVFHRITLKKWLKECGLARTDIFKQDPVVLMMMGILKSDQDFKIGEESNYEDDLFEGKITAETIQYLAFSKCKSKLLRISRHMSEEHRERLQAICLADDDYSVRAVAIRTLLKMYWWVCNANYSMVLLEKQIKKNLIDEHKEKYSEAVSKSMVRIKPSEGPTAEEVITNDCMKEDIAILRRLVPTRWENIIDDPTGKRVLDACDILAMDLTGYGVEDMIKNKNAICSGVCYDSGVGNWKKNERLFDAMQRKEFLDHNKSWNKSFI